MNFRVVAEVARLTESENDPTVVAFSMDLTAFCQDCGEQFQFIGLPLGFSHYQPTVSIDGKVARIPIMPPGCPPKPGLAGFRVTQTIPDDNSLKQ